MNKQNANSTLYNSEVSRQISKKRKEIPKRIRQKFPQKKKKKRKVTEPETVQHFIELGKFLRGKKLMNTTNRTSANRNERAHIYITSKIKSVRYFC